MRNALGNERVGDMQVMYGKEAKEENDEGKRVRRTSFITVVQPREAESQNVDGKSQPALP